MISLFVFVIRRLSRFYNFEINAQMSTVTVQRTLTRLFISTPYDSTGSVGTDSLVEMSKNV